MKISKVSVWNILFFLSFCLFSQEDVFEDTKTEKLPSVPVSNIKGKIMPPSVPEQEEALLNIREIFAKDLKLSDKKSKIELAEKFIEESKDTKHSVPVRYVFLSEAQKLFAETVESEKFALSIDLMDSTFVIDKIRIFSEKLTIAGKSAKTQEENLSVAVCFQKFYELCLSKELYDEAQNALNTALSFARRAKNKEIEESIKVELKDLFNLKRQYSAIQPYLQKLAKEPNDKIANLNVGKYYCLILDDWEKGLPFLKNSAEEKFANVASIELTNPQATEIMLKLGDMWWELSENKNNREFQIPLARRACYWYENALPSLESLDKLRIEKRIQTATLNIFKSSMEFPKEALIALSFDPDTVSKRGARYLIRNLASAGYNVTAYDLTYKKISDNDSVAEFDGAKSRIVIKNPKEDLSKNFTIAMWLKSEDEGRRRNPYNKSYGGEGTITIEPDGTINFYFGSAGNDLEPYTSIRCPGAVIIGKWSHIAIVRDDVRKIVSVYLNGEKKAESHYDFKIKASEKDILIGSGYAGFFKGQMDDFLLSNTALSEKEIKKIFKASEKKFR